MRGRRRRVHVPAAPAVRQSGRHVDAAAAPERDVGHGLVTDGDAATGAPRREWRRAGVVGYRLSRPAARLWASTCATGAPRSTRCRARRGRKAPKPTTTPSISWAMTASRTWGETRSWRSTWRRAAVRMTAAVAGVPIVPLATGGIWTKQGDELTEIASTGDLLGVSPLPIDDAQYWGPGLIGHQAGVLQLVTAPSRDLSWYQFRIDPGSRWEQGGAIDCPCGPGRWRDPAGKVALMYRTNQSGLLPLRSGDPTGLRSDHRGTGRQMEHASLTASYARQAELFNVRWVSDLH